MTARSDGAAEYSRDLDLAVLATPEALPALRAALESLNATVIAVPSFDVRYLDRGHAVHFSTPDGSTSPLRVDIVGDGAVCTGHQQALGVEQRNACVGESLRHGHVR